MAVPAGAMPSVSAALLSLAAASARAVSQRCCCCWHRTSSAARMRSRMSPRSGALPDWRADQRRLIRSMRKAFSCDTRCLYWNQLQEGHTVTGRCSAGEAEPGACLWLAEQQPTTTTGQLARTAATAWLLAPLCCACCMSPTWPPAADLNVGRYFLCGRSTRLLLSSMTGRYSWGNTCTGARMQ